MDITSMILGALIGAMPSWFISKHFAIRSSKEAIQHQTEITLMQNKLSIQQDMSDELNHFIKNNLEVLFLKNLFPKHFSSQDNYSVHNIGQKENDDIPWVGGLHLDHKHLERGKRNLCLFRVNDNKWNFATNIGPIIRFPERKNIKSNPEVFGYMSFEINVLDNWDAETYDLEFDLLDSVGNENNVLVKLPVG
ncbi:hypothetical protein [Vibrio parahaemolyticus]|uniref:hypothetical protein n=1 Tax=Vibrio parahaemolyticus TaxID=670 RepID=UPI0012B2141D|nr:hypothetical protein [Vibrio parahaemolyticus]